MAESPFNVPLVGMTPEQQRSDEKPLPRLRLHHLFAMMAVSAVLLASFGPGLGSTVESKTLGKVWIAMAVWGTLYAFLTAFAITVTVFGIFWRLRGIRFPNHPGHWLLVAIAASYILNALLLTLFAEFVSNSRWIIWAHQLPGAILDIYIGFKQCAERRWRWVFYLKVLAAFVPVLGDLPLMVMLSRANLWDRRLGVRRDVLHRCGAAVQMAMCILMLGLVIFFIVSFALQ